MAPDLTTIPGEEPEVDDVLADFAFPDRWHADALDAAREVLSERPDLAGPELVALESACNLLDTASRLEEIARAADFVGIGASGQQVCHFAVGEARLARVQSAAILHRLTVLTSGPAMTNSQRGRAAAQARWAKAPGGRRG